MTEPTQSGLEEHSEASLDTAPSVQPQHPQPAAAYPRSIADGVTRPLDPQYVDLGRMIGVIFTTVVAASLGISGLVVFFVANLPQFVMLALLAGAAALTAFLGWFTQAWPPIEHRHMAYRVDQLGIEIRQGVFWHKLITVPRSRIQHTDVSQGPLERRFGLARLHMYTAGTEHSKVELPGLSEGIARQIRDHLMAGGEDDAV